MARLYETALAELENSKEELAEVEAMTDEEACYRYNNDSKSEIVKVISEDIEYLKIEVGHLIPAEDLADPVVEIFGTYEAMNSFLY